MIILLFKVLKSKNTHKPYTTQVDYGLQLN